MPRRPETRSARVVGLARIERQVQPGRLVDELGLGQRGRAALHDERGELAVQIGGRSRVLVPKLIPARAVACRVARINRWDVQVLYLERVAGDDACPRT